jgi:hypothetical protein
VSPAQRRRTRPVGALLALSVLAAPAGQALAQNRDPVMAQALFDEAKKLVEAGRVAEACPKFLASFRLDPKPGGAFNLGDCYERIGQTASAWARYLEAASLAEQAKQAERAAYARDAARALEPKLARLTIAVPKGLAGLEVKRDGAVIDPAAWGTAVPVDPGRHTIEAAAPGKAPLSFSIDVAAGNAGARVEIPELLDRSNAVAPPPPPPGVPVAPPPPAPVVKAPPPPSPPPAPEPAAPGPSKRRVAAFVTGGLGVASLVAGAITGGLAIGKKSTIQSNCGASAGFPGDPSACNQTGVTAGNALKALAAASTATFVVGVVGVGVGVALFVTEPKAKAPAVGLNGVW